MENFIRIFGGCVMCFLGVMAGLAFARGDIGVGIFQLCLAATNLPRIAKDFDDK